MKAIKFISVISYLLQINSAMPPPMNPSVWPSLEMSNIGNPQNQKSSSILEVLYRQKRQIVPNTGRTKVCGPGLTKDTLGRCVLPRRRFIPATTSAKYTFIQTTNASVLDLTTNEITATTNQLPQPSSVDSASTTSKTQPVSSNDEITRSAGPTTLVTHSTYPVEMVSVPSELADNTDIIKSQETEAETIPSTTNKHSRRSHSEPDEEVIVISSTTLSSSSSILPNNHEPQPHTEHQRSIPDYVRTTHSHNCYGREKTNLPSRAYEDYDY